MKKIAFLLLFLPALVQAQDQSGHCSHVKSFQNQQLRSNTFSISQIAETERYDVHFYFLDLAMTNTSTTLSGATEIHASANEDLDSALIEFFSSFTITGMFVDGNPVSYSRINTAIKIPVNKLQNENFIIRVEYNGTPPTAQTNPLGGGGMTNAFSPSWGNQVTWSLSEPFAAYEWFPCKQSLKDKADSCEVWITVPNACKAGSNGLLQQVVDLGNGTSRYEWKHRHPIDYYLISVSVAEYIEYNVTAYPAGSGPVLIQNYIYNNPGTLPNFQADIDETADFIVLYDVLFGPYPFADEKYGHCMAPISGGMEHQTMTTQGFFSNTLTCHELAHQWFGDQVTCASWCDIWVNEGFASYSEYLMLENLYPGQQIMDMANRHQNIKSQPGGSVWVLDSLNDASIFDGRLVYDKGAAIIHTLRFLMNDDTDFFNTLKQYQIDFKDSVATGLDFIHVAETVSGLDFTNFMQEWYFGEGFPTYQVRWNKSGNDMHVQITHSTSASGVTPTFTNDLELKFSRTSLPDTIIRFQIASNMEQFLIPNVPSFASVNGIDPNNWIINGTGSITNDANLFVGIQEADHSSPELLIYPNPNNGIFTIETTSAEQNKIEIFDTRSRLVYSGVFTGKTVVDLSNYSKGAYLIQLSNSKENRIIRRVIRN
ncbi:MAG: T9SS type A sorting domain-containing protein [Flavobacteriales bacterium]|nr:T9SS type A sorting domain-containing protein [Flavobacteriales bacterium]